MVLELLADALACRNAGVLISPAPNALTFWGVELSLCVCVCGGGTIFCSVDLSVKGESHPERWGTVLKKSSRPLFPSPPSTLQLHERTSPSSEASGNKAVLHLHVMQHGPHADSYLIPLMAKCLYTALCPSYPVPVSIRRGESSLFHESLLVCRAAGKASTECRGG